MNNHDQRKPRKYKTLRRAAKAAKTLGCRMECHPTDVLNLMEELHLLREQIAVVNPEFKEWNALDFRRERARLLAAAPELLEALSKLLNEVDGLIGESAGVVGLHLNGDIAPWSDLEEGGRFERLSSMSKARAAIAKATGDAQ